MSITRFIALFDLHYGKEWKTGRLYELHDPRALGAVLEFARDFRPDVVILGGDMLDCGAISHHREGQIRLTEGLRLKLDMEGLRKDLLAPIESLRPKRMVFHVGNHEDWLEDFVDEHPGVEGIVDLRQGLGLGRAWEFIPQGQHSKLGKLYFVHGDQIRSSQYSARWAIEAYEKSIRFGHFHRAQLHTKISALDQKDMRTGMGVPALCRRDPGYGKGAPNQWAEGFLWGYVFEDGSFSDYLTFIVGNRFVANGRVYQG